MATVVDIEDANGESIELIIKLKETFCGNFLFLRWRNETKIYLILNLLESLAYSIKGMFYAVSSDYCADHRTQFNVFLALDTNTFVCHQDKLYKLVKLLHKRISKNTYATAFMRFDKDSLSLKIGKRNKNDHEKYQLFAAKLYNQIQRCKNLSDTENCISDKSVCNADSTSGKNKTCSSYKLDYSFYRIDTTILYRKPCRKKKTCASRKSEDSQNCFKSRCSDVDKTRKPEDSRHYSYCCYVEHLDIEPFDFVAVPGVPRKLEGRHNCLLPFKPNSGLPLVPDYHHVNGGTEISSSRSENINENNVRSDLQSHSLVDEPHSNNYTNSNSGNNSVPMDIEEYEHSSNSGQAISNDGTSRNILASDVSQNDSRSELCIDGSSYNRTGQFHFSGINFDTDLRLPPPAVVQQNRIFRQGQIGDSTSGQQQNTETTFTESNRPQAIPQQRNGNDDLVPVLERVRSPEYADLNVRLGTFARWPTDTTQTPAQVAEAGFYYTGFQDTVRCFVCDGGLKNWDPTDDPWIEHARWFPQCAYVRHIKGEEFINLVRMSTEETDEEDDYTVHRGATWGRAENSNTSADSVSNEITEPSVLENKDARFLIEEMGFSKKDVAMAINDIFKNGKQDFTRQDIADILLEKEMRGEPSNSVLSVDCPPSIGNMSATEQAICENKHLKELLQCIECKSKQRNILFLPCTHHVVCELCSRDLHICTYCYRIIKDKVRTYMS
ncbi:hypothetical protein CHS0354_025966 [Potamilus streckersoni]|uniref:Uncharacterized protein n=1 Tax=Potamilus streckersoni TaxID=2493646 RepID=A0AAE0W7T2_9BIVA|nr:hypothetical protein CHS0354_025966 [Potamilus streckersoni]